MTDIQKRRAKAIIWPMLPMLLRTAQYLTRHEHEAEDLVQETVIKAMRAIDQFEDGTDAKAWLLTILRRVHIDTIRHRQRRVATVSMQAGEGFDFAAPDSDHPAGEHDAHWDDPAALLERFDDDEVIEALQALPEEMRWTLLLVDVEQLEHAQAAAVLGVAEGTVKSRSHRGRAMLRDLLWELAEQRGWKASSHDEA